MAPTKYFYNATRKHSICDKSPIYLKSKNQFNKIGGMDTKINSKEYVCMYVCMYVKEEWEKVSIHKNNTSEIIKVLNKIGVKSKTHGKRLNTRNIHGTTSRSDNINSHPTVM